MGTKLTPSSRFTVMMVSIAILAILTVGGVAWFEARESLIDSSFENLSAIERSKARQIENYFDGVEDQIVQLAGDLTIVEGAVRLNRGFDALALEPVPEDLTETVEGYYVEQFLPRLATNTTGTPDYAIFEPERQTGKQLQYLYLADNANAVGVKHFLDDAGDGSDYSRWHAHYHPGFRSLLEHSNYYDLFIVDIETGDIVYTVFKETDVGTNLVEGPYRNSGLGDVVKEVMADPIRESVKIVDFKPYTPSYNTPAAFVAAPIYNGDHPVGVLALQLPITEINAVMTSEADWEAEGMGESGETYLVGSDRLMRSDSRFLIEDKPEFLASVRATGVQAAIVEKMDALDSTILLQRVDSAAAVDAIAGSDDAAVVTDYRGVDVLSSYAPLDINGLDWVILSEISRDEVLAPVDQLLRRVLIAAALFVSFIALASAILARRFMRPVRDAVGVAERVIDRRGLDLEAAADDYAAVSPELEFDSEVPGVMGELAHRMNLVIADAESERSMADRRYDEFVDRVTAPMPWSAGERFRRGEHDAVDVGTRCFAVAVLMVDTTPDGEATEALIDASVTFNDEIQELARLHGVDLFSHVGFEYVGIVGLTATYLDSVDRAIAFARDVLELRVAGASDRDPPHAAAPRVAIDVSAMRGAMQQLSPYGYQVWGDAIIRSQALAYQSEAGAMCITDAVHSQLAEHAEVSAEPRVVELARESVTSWTISRLGGVPIGLTDADAVDVVDAG